MDTDGAHLMSLQGTPDATLLMSCSKYRNSLFFRDMYIIQARGANQINAPPVLSPIWHVYTTALYRHMVPLL